MNPNQEPKYEIIDGKLCNRQTKVPIPDDEPVFILRAKDKHALMALGFYRNLLKDDIHRSAVELRYFQFRKFSKEHPERMALPTTAITKDWENLS